MATLHSLTCPHCLKELLAEFTDAVGGLVQNNVTLVDPTTLRPVEVPDRAYGEVPQATDAAVRHAEATGVDLTQVEGTGKPVTVPVTEDKEVPAITKADVAAAAAQNDEPVNATPAEAPPATAAATALADEHGVDLADVSSSGDKITKADVTAHVEGQA